MTGAVIEAVLTGGIRPFGPEGQPSAIAKEISEGPQQIGPVGFIEDRQADLIHHGGPDKAIHHYPRDHYPYWQTMLGDHALLCGAGAFGENISTSGLTEGDVCLGDRYRLGTALVEISQGRQPCWKLGHRFGDKSVPELVIKSGRAGWYYRVIETGAARGGDRLELLDRPLPQWPVARLFSMLIGGEGKAHPTLMRDLSKIGPLSASWQSRARKLAG